MLKIIGLAGSVRKKSFNAYLLNAARDAMPEGSQLVISSIADIPLYNGDEEEAHGIPSSVTALKEEIAESDGILIVSPEYNQSIPGVLKNAIDWCSRPDKDIQRVFGGKPVALLGTTTGRGGTRHAQTAWLPVFRALSLNPWLGKQMYVDSASKNFSDDGKLVDEKIQEMLVKFMSGFVHFASVSSKTRG